MTTAVCGLLLLAVVLVFGQTIHYEFVNYDDPVYVSQNAAIKDGVTWKAVAWSFTTFEGGNWNPVTWFSHMLDCQMFGLSPGWHHAVNVAFHILNSMLLFVLLMRMTAAPWRSAMAAALFALHPLHVESVAWVAERKDVLSMMFAMLTMLAYLRYVSRPSIIRYAPVFVLLALGLMSKPMLVTLPFVLLLLDYWPLGRWVRSPPGWSQSAWVKGLGQTAFWLVMEKLPLLVLSAAFSAVTYIAQQQIGAMAMLGDKISLPMRLANALVCYVAYLGKTAWPYPLIVFYPYVLERPWWQPAAAAVFLVAVTVVVILLWRRRPYLTVGWFWYLGTLLPVIGLIQVGSQSMADRYTYIPLIGIFIMGVWSAADLAMDWRYGRAALGALAGVVIAACMILTAKQVTHWADTKSLFEYALKITPDNSLAHNNLGVGLARKGRYQEAIEHYKEALRIRPDYFDAQNNLAFALVQTDRPAEAVEHYQQALRLKPDIYEVHINLGLALVQTNRPEEAIEHYRQALRISPDLFSAHYNIGNVLSQTGKFQEAIEYFEQALRLNPDFPEARQNLGVALAQTGRLREAIEQYEQAIRLKPDYVKAHFNLGNALVQAGRPKEAIKSYEQALRLQPDFTSVYSNLALVYADMHQSSEAISAAEKALELARSQGQTTLAKQIEEWLKSYRAGLSE